MTSSGVRALLRNRVYLGELSVGKHVNPSAHEALVTEEEWLAAQRHRFARATRSGRSPALLAGLVRCASCGHLMSRGGGGRGHTVYACHRAHSAGECPRPAAVTATTLERCVEEIALAELAKLKATASRRERDLEAARRALRTLRRSSSPIWR
jgi:hypothetical protein